MGRLRSGCLCCGVFRRGYWHRILSRAIRPVPFVSTRSKRQKIAIWLGVWVILHIGLLTLDDLRYAPPLPIDTRHDQDALRARLEVDTGLKLPPGTRVLRAERPPRSSRGSFEYTLYSEHVLDLPTAQDRYPRIIQVRVSEAVRSLESGIGPFKIKSPTSAAYHWWDHGKVQSTLTLLAAANGYYMSLSTHRD